MLERGIPAPDAHIVRHPAGSVNRLLQAATHRHRRADDIPDRFSVLPLPIENHGHFGRSLPRQRRRHRSGDAPTGDKLVDRAFDKLVRIDRFLRCEIGRDGWDGKGGPLRAELEGLKGRNATFATSTPSVSTRTRTTR